MFWFKKKPIDQRAMTTDEAEAYQKGHDDGVGMVLEMLTALDPEAMGDECREFVRRLILSHAVETADKE